MGDRDFRWHDGERLIRFGRGCLQDVRDFVGYGYALLTTPRAAGAAPTSSRRRLGPRRAVGVVDEIAGDLRA